MELIQNTQSQVPTSYNPNHIYHFYFTGGSSQTFSFVEQQVAWYNDNSGSLNFDIYYLGNIYWSNGVTTTTNTVNPSQTTTYIVAALSGTGCATTDTVTVNVNPVPNISISDETICEGDTATLVAIPDIIEEFLFLVSWRCFYRHIYWFLLYQLPVILLITVSMDAHLQLLLLW